MPEAVTRSIRVEVDPQYVPDQSRPDRDYYFFSYHVTLTNEGEETVQLMSRHWIITHGDGRVEEVKGPGVVGEQPTLEPGESFEYTSFCPLHTSTGTMQGTYQMVTEDGEGFDAKIPLFTLSRENMTYH
ncbi:MAG: Co2+/Mg2+ efflux protein ApaG [bacterium]